MDALLLTHVVCVSTWAGLVLGEGALELASNDEPTRRLAARAHFWLDVALELPLLLVVLATGSVLAVRFSPLAPVFWLKIAAGLVAIVLNLVCVGLVIQRRLRMHDVAALERISRRIRITAVGVPFGLFAAVLGFVLANG